MKTSFQGTKSHYKTTSLRPSWGNFLVSKRKKALLANMELKEQELVSNQIRSLLERHKSPQERLKQALGNPIRNKITARSEAFRLMEFTQEEIGNVLDIGTILLHEEECYNPEKIDQNFYKALQKRYLTFNKK